MGVAVGGLTVGSPLGLLIDAAASSPDGTDVITKLFMGAAALVGAFTAYRVAKRDSNADQLKEALTDIGSYKQRVADIEADFVDFRRYAYRLRSIMADHNIDAPEPPVLRSEHTT